MASLPRTMLLVVLLVAFFFTNIAEATETITSLNNLGTALSETFVGGRTSEKATREAELASRYTDLVNAETNARQQQAAYIAEEAILLSKTDIWKAAIAAYNAKVAEYNSLSAQYTEATNYYNGDDTSEERRCLANVTLDGITYDTPLCLSRRMLDPRINDLSTEVNHIDNILASLGEGDGIEEYTEAAAAAQELEALKPIVQKKLDAVILLRNVHEKYIADLLSARDSALSDSDILKAAMDAAAADRQAEKDVLDASKASVDATMQTLQAALDAWNSKQQEHEKAAVKDTADHVSFRDQVVNLIHDATTQGITAKSALYVERGGYGKLPPVNLRKNFTIEVWIYFDPTENDHTALPIISQKRLPKGDQTKSVFELRLRGGPASAQDKGDYSYYYWEFRMGSPESPGTALRLVGNEFQPSGWCHIAVSAQTEPSRKSYGRLFVNGKLEAVKGFSGSRWSSKEPILLGRLDDNTGSYSSNCAFDEFRVFTEAFIDESVIQEHMYNMVEESALNVRINIRFDDKYDVTTVLPSNLQNRLLDYSSHRLDGFYVSPFGLEGMAAKLIDSTAFGDPNGYTRFSDYGLSVDSKPEHQNFIAVPSQDLTGAFALEVWLKHKDGSSSEFYPKASQAVRDGSKRNEFVFTLEMVDTVGQCRYEFKMGSCQNAEAAIAEECGYAVELMSDEIDCSGWHHVAVMVSDNDVAKIFVDGHCFDEEQVNHVPSASGTCVKRLDPASNGARLHSSQQIQVGRLVDDIQFHSVEALADELRIWKKALTLEEVQHRMARVLPISFWDQQMMPEDERELLAYYPLDEAENERGVYDRVLRSIAELKAGTTSSMAFCTVQERAYQVPTFRRNGTHTSLPTRFVSKR